MCYVKSGKSASDVAAAAAAAAAAASSSATTAPVATDPFAFPELFNLGADTFGTIAEGLDKWNFGELLNGVAADSMLPTEFPLLESNSFLTKWYASEEASPADSVETSFVAPQLSPTSSSATLIPQQYDSYTVSPSSSASPNLVPNVVSPNLGVNYFPQLGASDVALPNYLQFTPATYATAAAPSVVYPTPDSALSTPATIIENTKKPAVAVVTVKSPSLSPDPVKQIKRPHDEITSGSDSCTDPLAAKRQKNTEAARRSRQRKVVQMETLQTQVSELQGENSRLNVRLAVVESEREQWVAKENELMERIRSLERQLNESHMAVVQLGLKKGVSV